MLTAERESARVRKCSGLIDSRPGSGVLATASFALAVSATGDVKRHAFLANSAAVRQIYKHLLAGTAFAGGVLALIVGDPQSAYAQCATSGSAPVVYSCATNTTTTNTTNAASPNAATSDRQQQFNDSISGIVNNGITVNGFGIALTSTLSGGTITLTNDGAIQINSGNTASAGGADAVDLTDTSGNGLITYSGSGSVNNQGTAGAAVEISNTGSGGITVDTSGNYTAANGVGLLTQATGGATSITITGGLVQATGTNADAILASTVNGTATVNVTGGIIQTPASGSQFNSNGIEMSSTGTGDIVVNMTGGQIGANAATAVGGSGIDALAGGTGNISITTAASTSIFANSGGGIGAANINPASAGNIVITANGSVTSNKNIGIDAENDGSGNTAVNGSGAVTAASVGIDAKATTGNVSVTGTGAINSGTLGIEATAGGGNVLVTPGASVNAGTVGTEGVFAGTSGTGTVTVNSGFNVGNATTTTANGISTQTVNGLNTVNITGGIIQTTSTGTPSGVNASSTGTGGVTVSMTGGQIGTSTASIGGLGIDAADSGTSGNISIATAAGTSIFANGDAIKALVNDAGSSGSIGVGASGISNAGVIQSTSGNGMDLQITSATATGNITATNSGAIGASGSGSGINALNAGSGSVTLTNTSTGTITGNVGIELGKSGAASIFNAGAITGTGGTAIDASTARSAVTINQTGGLITGAVTLSANADVLNISGGAIAGNIVGAGSSNAVNFNLGAGNTFTYADNFTGINQVNINSGTVVLNGADSAANVTVNGGTLAGTATLDPLIVTINTGGTFAPGTPSSPGTSMTIVGNLAFQSGAIYLIQVSPTSATSATITGTASLAGTLDIVLTPGKYGAKTAYEVLNAGSISGTFTGFGSPAFPGFTGALTYTSTDVLLNLVAALGAGTSLRQNQQNVANAVNGAFNSGAALPANFVSLFNLTGAPLANSLTQLDGEDATGAEHGAIELTNEFLSLMLDPFVYGRGGPASAAGALGFAPDQETTLPPDVALAYAGILKAPPKPAASFDQRWTVWGASYGGSGTFEGNATTGSTNVTASTYGFAAGADYHAASDLVFGFALAGAGTNWGLEQGLGTGRSDAFQAGVYGTKYFGPAYIGGALSFTNNWFTTNRIALGDQLNASFQGQSFGARVESGYRYALAPAMGVTPYAAIQAQSFHTPTYSETDLSGGGFGLTYNAQNATDTRTELGARFDELNTWNAMPVQLRAKLAWAHDWVGDPALTAVFQALPGSSFVVDGAPVPHNSALTSVGAELHLTQRWTLIGKFDGEFASSAQTYAGSGTLRYTW
ncbi:MAG TPA: autotransporter domain-containing protein [Xanthobacteraceae bacterium]|nr:autotransporter domain-containing protein [Xanthobacteraceae bacterium]